MSEEHTTMKEYLNSYFKRGRITKRMLEKNYDQMRVALTTDVGKNILIYDIEKFEDLIFKLIDNGFGYEKGQATDDDLVEMRLLKERILRISKQVNQYIALTGQEDSNVG